MIPEFTTVLGVDANYIRQLQASWPTWKKYQPHLWGRPLVVFYDKAQLAEADVRWVVERGMHHPDFKLVPWPRSECYESQRHKMLAGHIFVPADHVQTPYHLKIDADAIATRPAYWPDPAWFTSNPAWVAPRWGYTKGVGFLDALEAWGDSLDGLKYKPRLKIPHDPTHLRVRHSRMCSWVSFYKTSFTALVAELCREASGCDRLPVPSQDTTAWYVSERIGLPFVTVNQKSYGWENHPRLANLQARVQQVMG